MPVTAQRRSLETYVVPRVLRKRICNRYSKHQAATKELLHPLFKVTTWRSLQRTPATRQATPSILQRQRKYGDRPTHASLPQVHCIPCQYCAFSSCLLCSPGAGCFEHGEAYTDLPEWILLMIRPCLCPPKQLPAPYLPLSFLCSLSFSLCPSLCTLSVYQRDSEVSQASATAPDSATCSAGPAKREL